MKKRLTVLLLAAVVVLALASLALAATKKLHGSLAGSEGGKVTIEANLSPGVLNGKKVQVVHSLKGIVATKVPYSCEDGSTGSIDVKFGRIAVGDALTFSVDKQATPTMTVGITGKLGDQFGRKVTGQVRAEGSKVLPEGSKIACGTYELSSSAGSFTAK